MNYQLYCTSRGCYPVWLQFVHLGHNVRSLLTCKRLLSVRLSDEVRNEEAAEAPKTVRTHPLPFWYANTLSVPMWHSNRVSNAELTLQAGRPARTRQWLMCVLVNDSSFMEVTTLPFHLITLILSLADASVSTWMISVLFLGGVVMVCCWARELF